MFLIQGNNSCVGHTSIFTAPLPEGKQLTVISITTKIDEKSNDNSAMVIPFPRGEIKIVDSHRYEKIFTHLRQSFLHQKEDNSTVQMEHFKFESDLFSPGSEPYTKGYSFLVCTLIPGRKYYPFAYIHKRLTKNSIPVHPDTQHDIYIVTSSVVDSTKDYPKSWVNLCIAAGLNPSDISKVKHCTSIAAYYNMGEI